MRRVIVPVDGTELATRIYPDAVRLAGKDGAIILVRDVDREQFDQVTQQYRAQPAVAEAQQYLESQAEVLRTQGANVETHTLVFNDVATSIDEAARLFNADIIACATHGRNPSGRLTRGGVAWRMLSQSPVPILLRHVEGETVRDDAVVPQANRIMVPLDGSKLAESALPLADSLAKECGGSVWLILVVPVPLTTGPFVTTAYDVREDVRIARRYLEDCAARLDVETHIQIFTGGIVDALLGAARDFAVSEIVMASHGRTGLSRVVLGSVADALIHNLHLPIVVVPAMCVAEREHAVQPKQLVVP